MNEFLLRMQLRLSEPVTEEYFQFTLSYLDINTYKEIMIERDVVGLCGLPTCSRTIDKRIDCGISRIDQLRRKEMERGNQDENPIKYCSINCKNRNKDIITILPPFRSPRTMEKIKENLSKLKL